MDTRSQEQQKDLFASFFQSEDPVDVQRHPDPQQQAMFNSGSMPNQQQQFMGMNFPGNNNANFQLNMDLMGNVMSMNGAVEHPSMPTPPHYTPQMLLDQQVKLSQLQQLQQLQNQIQHQLFQQQLALISGQTITPMPDQPELQKDQVPNNFGLLTPAPSTELRPIQNSDFVTPLSIPYMAELPEFYQPLDVSQSSPNGLGSSSNASHFMRPPGTSSAPANIAFNPPSPLPSPSELEMDISPITSPWLAPYQQQPTQRSMNKRTASPSEDPQSTRSSRKRHSPSNAHPSPSFTMPVKKPTRNTKSATNTPLLRSSRSRRNSSAIEGDSPSPVDLSMPPPAPPGGQQNSSSSVPTLPTLPERHSPVAPVTPASIMNLGRLGISSGLTPASQDPKFSKPDLKGKATVVKPGKKSGTLLISPAVKPILPAGNASNLHFGSSASSSPIIPQSRKSHKVAEQKRRDSLKTTFDDLRVLLPPIPLPSDENFPDEPILPGALPPRGPPKAGGDGPNKGVSKLQLLRCGNDYIRQLKGRVERRDEEITKLRSEIRRMREVVGEEHATGGEYLDLERDIDAGEVVHSNVSQAGGSVAGDDEPDEGDEM